MLVPSIFGESLFDDWFDLPSLKEFRDIDRKLYGKHASHEMKTDVHEHEDHYEVDVDLPGFKKDEITVGLENGYLTISAAKGLDEDQKTPEGKLNRQERWAGTMQRSFYVGEALTEEDITAKYENGVLTLTVPKKEAKKLPEKHLIQIAG